MSSPTQRSLAKLRKEQWPLVQITEHWNSFAHVRNDLFGFIDVLAVRGDVMLAIQTTSGSNVAARFAKIQSLPSVVYWLQCGARLVIHGWAKRGPRGKAKRWSCREVEIVLGPTGSPVMKEEKP